MGVWTKSLRDSQKLSGELTSRADVYAFTAFLKDSREERTSPRGPTLLFRP